MEQVMEFLKSYGMWAALVLIFLEYACFPLPSEVVLPFAGAMTAAGSGSLTAMFLGSILAALLGSLVCYGVGFFGGDLMLDRLLKRFPRLKKGMDASRKTFQSYSSAAVCFGRVVPLCRTYISVAAGLSKQKIPSFLLFSACGIAVWNGALLAVGYFLGSRWEEIGVHYGFVKWVILAAAAGAFLWFLYKKKKTR